jgi:ATP-binding cassette subfamily E protein 1
MSGKYSGKIRTRIAVIDFDLCFPEKCNWECWRVCPVNKTGKICIDNSNSKPKISEQLCTGCGICVHRCPFNAIKIINLEAELGRPVHRYGTNRFVLYGLPVPVANSVVGLVGMNGIGKTTTIKILSGQLVPNLGEPNKTAGYDEIARQFRGMELQDYFQKLASKSISYATKPQEITKLPKHFKGTLRAFLKSFGSEEKVNKLCEMLQLSDALERPLDKLSGGELQRAAIGAVLLKEAQLYFFDEPCSFLDVKQRLNVARIIRALPSDTRSVLVVEHDLAVLDYLSDYIHVLFGVKGAYGVVSSRKAVGRGINEYLHGYLKNENIRFRTKELSFAVLRPEKSLKKEKAFSYPELRKCFDGFELEVKGSTVYRHEVIGILGENATGKTTFMRMLAGELKPDNTKLDIELKIAYKPQYVKAPERITLRQYLESEGIYGSATESEFFKRAELSRYLDSELSTLSGGELQRVAIAITLAREADIYLFDEPSAFLDVEERLGVADALRNFVERAGKVAFVVEHDLIFLDYLSDRMIVFEGEPSKHGRASEIIDKEDAMNRFLGKVGITFRRDSNTGRARANKPGSVKDRKQKESGNYFYTI